MSDPVSAERLRQAAERLREVPDSIGCRCAEPGDVWFDRSICPEPCGSMHDICNDCGYPLGGCLAADLAAMPSAYDLAVAAWLEWMTHLEVHGESTARALAVADAVLGES